MADKMVTHEVARVNGFASGEVTCPRCGRVIRLHFNGGELDGAGCCGLRFATETLRVDLIVTETLPWSDPRPADVAIVAMEFYI